MQISWSGNSTLVKELEQLSRADFRSVANIQAQEIYARGKRKGGTPRKTGFLQGDTSLSYQSSENGAVVGYKAHYAPHVEYGHRTRGSRMVEGQFFFKKNVDTQKPLFKRDLMKVLEVRK